MPYATAGGMRGGGGGGGGRMFWWEGPHPPAYKGPKAIVTHATHPSLMLLHVRSRTGTLHNKIAFRFQQVQPVQS